MAIQKLEFYEGAALYRLIRSLGEVRVRVDGGMVILDECLGVFLKYCTRTRSPWSFTFSTTERSTLAYHALSMPVVVGLVCGADGVATLQHKDYVAVAGNGASQIALFCSRRYDEHYAIGGPAGKLSRKIAPSAWNRLLVAKG